MAEGGGPSNKKAGRFSVRFFQGDQPSESTSKKTSDEGEVNPSFSGEEISNVDGAHPTVPHDANDVTAITVESPEEDRRTGLYLYEEDMKQMPRVSTFLHSMMMAGSHATYPSEKEEEAAKNQPQQAKLGMIIGVYLPNIQHIMGLLIFIRLPWIVGISGVVEAFFMLFYCSITTFVTCISLSAIATNGMIQGGGSYYLISRNLGPAMGGSIGVLLYLANTLATTLYLLGAIEILLLYMAPDMAVFGDMESDAKWNNYRFYGSIFLILLAVVVAVGVKLVAFVGPLSLACVMISLVCIVIGAGVINPSNLDTRVCMLGDRLLRTPFDHETDSFLEKNYTSDFDWCTKNSTGIIWQRYCSVINDTEVCDDYFVNNEVTFKPALPGITTGVITDNKGTYYLGSGEVTLGVEGDEKRGEVISEMATNFVLLCAIIFPGATDILTGANMSGDLKDPQRALPSGTILSQLTCTAFYLLFVLLYGATVTGPVLRDKFGISLGGKMVAALIAWPHQWVCLIGAYASAMGAALQCLCGAPRLLQAIARDEIIPFLGIFKVTNKKGEPFRALILSFIIAEIGVLIANLDVVAPIIDVFFVLCYMFVNLSCVLQTLLKTPNWRPRFKYYHWSIAFIGAALNFSLCIVAGWYYALAAFVFTGFIYVYILYKGGEKEWGDGLSGLTMMTAQKSLLRMDDEPHTKNWRPQILILTRLDPSRNKTVEHKRFFTLAGQLKAGKGLAIVATAIEGNVLINCDEVKHAKELLKATMNAEKMHGFPKVVMTSDTSEAFKILIQSVGLGGLRHNTVMVAWPEDWRQANNDETWHNFLDTIKTVNSQGLALLIPRGLEHYPDRKTRLGGSIDVWWIVHTGGMLILLAFLLKQSKVWKNCNIRIFTVAHLSDNSIQMKKNLEQYLYQIRIPAEVHIEEMYDTAITAYTVERTLDMEKRIQLKNEVNKMLHEPDTTQNKAIAMFRRQSLHNLSRRHTTPNLAEVPHAIALAKTPEQVIEMSRQAGAGFPHSSNMRRQTSAALIATSTVDGAEDNTVTSLEALGLERGGENNNNTGSHESVQFTFSATNPMVKKIKDAMSIKSKEAEDVPPTVTEADGRLKRMHTAVQLNRAIRNNSSDAQMVIVNCPEPPSKDLARENYMEYLEVLTDGIKRVLMVRGSGKEVVTMYS